MLLRKEDQDGIARFCDQIAGAVCTALLLRQMEEERRTADRLLLNVLPEAVAAELKEHGRVEPQTYGTASVLFTDFKGFTAATTSGATTSGATPLTSPRAWNPTAIRSEVQESRQLSLLDLAVRCSRQGIEERQYSRTLIIR